MDYIIDIKQPSASEFSELRAKVGWGITNLNITQSSLDNSLFHVTARVDSKFIGMGRVIGDGIMFFYVQYLVVYPDFQRQGIGDSLML